MYQVVRSLLLCSAVSSFFAFQSSAQLWSQLGADIDGAASPYSGRFGESVSLSADGGRVAAGGKYCLRIFEYSGESWVQLGAEIAGYVSDVSISADGSRVAVGDGTYNGVGGAARGLVRVFEYSAGDWHQLGADIYGEADSDYCGNSISLSADGTRLAVGAGNNDGGGPNSGQVRIFEYSGGSWVQLGSDIYGAESWEGIGDDISLSADGSRVAFEAAQQVRVFDYSAGSWSQLGADISGISGSYVSSVSLNSDGSLLAFGAGGDVNGTSAGQVRIFEYSGASWVQLGAAIDGEATNDYSGNSISLCSDGSRVAVGAWRNDGNGEMSGHTRIFEYSGGDWFQLSADIDGEAEGDQSGVDVSLSADGSRVAIGAPGNDDNGTSAGQVRVFSDNQAAVLFVIIGGGSVSPPSGDYQMGTNLLLAATADAGWLFLEWSGDLSGDYTTATTNLLINDNKTVIATFSADADADGLLNTNEYALGTDPRNPDTDFDGLSDSDEVHTYGTNPLSQDSDSDGLSDADEINTYNTNPNSVDSDSDGFDDFFEVSTGYDPASDASVPELHSNIRTAIEFEFYASTSSSYRIEATDSLSNTWEIVEAVITNEGPVVQRFYSTKDQPKRFFRAKKN